MNQGIRHIFNRRTRLLDDDGSASSSDNADDHCDSEIKKDAQEEVNTLDIDALVHVAVELENLEPVTIVKQASFSRHRRTRRAMRAELAEELEIARMNSSQEWSVASSDAGHNSELEINVTRMPRSESSRRSTSRGRRSSSRDRGELTRASCEDAIRQVRERSSERRPRRGSKDKILACLENPSADTAGEQDRHISPSTQTEDGGSDHKEQAASTSPGETSCTENNKEKKPSSSSRHSNGSLATSHHTVASGKPSLEKSMSSRRIETRKDRGSDFKRSSSGHFPRTSLGGRGKQGANNDRSPTHGDDSPKEPYRADCSESKPPTTPEISNVSPLHETPARPLENATPATHRARRVGSNQQSSSRRIVLRKKASSEDLTSKVSRKDSCDGTSHQELTAQKDAAPHQHRDSRSSSNSEWKHRSGSVDRKERRSASHDDSVPQPLRNSRFEKGKPYPTVDTDSHSDDDDSESSLDFHKCFTNVTSSKSGDKALEKKAEKVTPSSFVSRYGDKTADRVSKTSTAPKAANGREKRPVRKISLQIKPLKSEANPPSLVAGEGTLDAHQNRSFRRDNEASRVPGRSKSEEWSSLQSVECERPNKAPSLRQSMHSQQARDKGIPRHSTREDVQRVTHFFSWDDDDSDDDDSSAEMVVQAIDYEKNMDRKRLLCKANSATSLVVKGSKHSTEKAPSSIRSLRM